VVCALSAIVVALGLIGGDVDSGPFAFVYWALPTLVAKVSVQQPLKDRWRTAVPLARASQES
jgi:hypothetical protein